jgi:hypothetical protein
MNFFNSPFFVNECEIFFEFSKKMFNTGIWMFHLFLFLFFHFEDYQTKRKCLGWFESLIDFQILVSLHEYPDKNWSISIREPLFISDSVNCMFFGTCWKLLIVNASTHAHSYDQKLSRRFNNTMENTRQFNSLSIGSS